MEEKPVVIILRGDDRQGIQQALQGMQARLGDPSIASLNLTRLEGRSASEEELRTATLAMPFLSERRLVILTNPLARATNAQSRTRFINLLDALPDTTALVLVVEDHEKVKRGEAEWETLTPGHWLVQWVGKSKGRGMIRDVALPRLEQMAGWIRKQAESLKGQFTPAAAATLAAHTGNDTLLAKQEIEKLLEYVNYARPVEAEEVEMLVAPGGQVDIFSLVDAMANGDAAKALRSLNKLLEEQDAFSLFGMVLRQFRLLLQTREVLDEGGGAERVASELRQPPFVAQKLSKQAGRFSMTALETIHHKLLEMDEAAKTGQMPLDLALQTFVASLAR